MTQARHFLQETDFTRAELDEVFALARSFKRMRNRHTPPALKGQSWAMLFHKPSTRTRISFEVGIHELGGFPIVLNAQTMQLGRGESIADTARVLSGYCHGLILRTHQHEIAEEFARTGTIPVINALTDRLHPCQTYTDAFTLAEAWAEGDDLVGSLKGRRLAFFGDCASNMATSLAFMCAHVGMRYTCCGPRAYGPDAQLRSRLDAAGLSPDFHYTEDTDEAARDADAIYTDVWVSMGDEEEADVRKRALRPFTVTRSLLDRAGDNAIFLHCLPAHPGEEVTQEVLDDPRSRVFTQAANRLHVQKAIMAALAEGHRH